MIVMLFTRLPWLADVLAGVAVAVVSAAGALTGERHHVPLGVDLATAGLAGLAAVFGRRAPIPVLVVAAVVEIGFLLAGWATLSLIFAVGWALYQIAVRYERRRAWLVSLTYAVMFWVVSVLGYPEGGWWTPVTLTCFTFTGMATAAGEAVRSRRAYIAEVEDRARRAEQSREDEVRRRVAEERLRIARELHDVVAHHIAVINVQSGAAAYALTRQPEAAGPPLAHIRRASGLVLRELTSIVGLLRRPGDSAPETGPQPGLDRLPELIEHVEIDFVQEGEPRPLPASADLAAYRIVQEALTNARKHGVPGSPVRLRLAWQRDRLTIEVGNEAGDGVGADVPAGSGFGLIGMRERAAAAGGMIQAGRDGGRFTVRAWLPLSGEERL